MTNNTEKKQLPIKLILILVILGAFVGIFLRTLTTEPSQQEKIESRDVPVFSLPALIDDGYVTSEDIKQNAPLLVNIWASWCAPCRKEHKMLQKLSTDYNIKIIGLNYKDSPENGRNFIERHGNPFFKVANDQDGLSVLNWGIRGVPETFIIDAKGKIVYRHTGEIRDHDFEKIVSEFNKVKNKPEK